MKRGEEKGQKNLPLKRKGERTGRIIRAFVWGWAVVGQEKKNIAEYNF